MDFEDIFIKVGENGFPIGLFNRGLYDPNFEVEENDTPQSISLSESIKETVWAY